MKRKHSSRSPVHKHGVYNKPRFGLKDEKEAVKDYRELRGHVKNRQSKKILSHIIKKDTTKTSFVGSRNWKRREGRSEQIV